MSEKQAKQRRKAAAKNGNKPDAAGEITPAPGAAEAPQDMPYPAVVVMRIPGEQPGQERIDFADLNGIDPLSVPTLLRLAAHIRETNMGLPQK